MRSLVYLLSVLLFFAFLPQSVAAEPADLGQVLTAQPKKKKKRRKRRRRRRRRKRTQEAKEVKEAPKEEPKEEAPKEPTPEELEAARIEAAKKKLEAEGRSKSKVTPGTASRWSNKGAMVPVASPVPVTAPMPERNVPITSRVETPGQDLLGGGREEILSARLSLGGYHLQTNNQDLVFVNAFKGENTSVPELNEGVTRDINFLRARATMGYEQIAGSDFSLRLDLEYRPQINGSRFTDQRLNELNVSYGLTEFRRSGGPWWGVSLGRVAVREAGYAQADGLAARFRIVDWLNVGLFGGVTGNPYGYNWNLRTTEIFSADWITGGGFISLQLPDLIVNVAGVVTYANIDVNLADIDRVYLYLDAAYLILPELNVMVNGWLDVLPDGQLIQNLDGTVAWTPTNDLSLSVGGGRFSTVLYALTTNYTYVANGENVFDPGLGRIVGVDGEPIVPFDSVLMTTVYNQARARAAYRIFGDLEVIARFTALFRDASVHQDALQAAAENTVVPATTRLLPGAGIRYRNPSIVDANAGFTYILDDQSQADAAVTFGLGRGLAGLYLSGDVRYYVGETGALDGGVSLSYTFPRDWFPGALSIRGMFRYFMEDVTLIRPVAGEDPEIIEGGEVILNPNGRETLEGQESILGYGGIEWRL